jgi:hypothetical protein
MCRDDNLRFSSIIINITIMDVNDIIQNQEQKWGEERIDEDTMVKKPKDLHELGVLLGLEEESEDDCDENYPNGGTVEAYDIEVEKELCEDN